MQNGGELGEFLRARRAGIRPSDVGLATFDGPGLRCEELAHLAGVSLAYYIRIEQGQSPAAAPGVLDAIARVLTLTEDERVYLHGLARSRPRARASTVAERARPALARLVDALDTVPAAVLGRSMDILAWNRLAHALLAGHLDFASPRRASARPNLARLTFLDPRARDLYVDWHERTRDVVAYLRAQADRRPDDARLSALVGELSIRSGRFGVLWASRPARENPHGRLRLRHPAVGDIDLVHKTLTLTEAPDQLMSILYAAEGSAAELRLRLLAKVATGPPPASLLPS
jgi:transcriptional regulator with XRE-family HTH domain